MNQGAPKAIALIVEDDHDLLQVTAMLLQESGFDTLECESAEAALAVMLLGEHDVNIVFADIRLSGAMDGVDLAQELKMRWPRLMIILTSGNAGQRLMHLPFGVQYMAKPWRPLNLLMAAERAIRDRSSDIA